LFHLAGGQSVAKYPATIGSNNLYQHTSYGPFFPGGHDLVIVNDCNTRSCSSTVGGSYTLPDDLDGTVVLAGQQEFTVAEIEVFVRA
jgi:hypothetical protein